jgi:FkbH-like protein
MYESEVNSAVAKLDEIPSEVRAMFSAFRELVTHRTSLPWAEHCTECAWPTCYETCTLYTPREDLKCRRFLGGMVRVSFNDGVMPYIVKITFKRWAKLYAPANLKVVDLPQARAEELKDLQKARLIRFLPGSTERRIRRIRQRYVAKRDSITNEPINIGVDPSHFVVECYNPADKAVDLTISVGPIEASAASPFEQRIFVEPGYNRAMMEIENIGRRVNLNHPVRVEITPNHNDELITLYFGCTEFVRLRSESVEYVPTISRMDTDDGGKKIKCVVWDLDNTVWDGILVEDGLAGVKLKSGIHEIIAELDRRGILHSVVSKNDPENGKKALAHFGLAEYFLYPQISWDPKSIGIQRIANLLDIGLDTFLFVDDSEFERAEVSESVPAVRVLDAENVYEIPTLRECEVPITAESRKRRQFYLEAVERALTKDEFVADYEGFLRSCQLRIKIQSLDTSNLGRVHELTQRTNQMNFSGNRYTIGFLEEIMNSSEYSTFVIECADRFGEYGIIGFSLVRNCEPRMTDLMFSCRIQHKRVDHAVLRFMIERFRHAGFGKFYANFRRTERNAFAGKIFNDFGFIEISEADGVTNLLIPANAELKSDGVVEIVNLVV